MKLRRVARMVLAQNLISYFTPFVTLALVAMIGYLVGQMRRAEKERTPGEQQLARALAVAEELEAIANRLQRALRSHMPAVLKFNAKMARIEQMAVPAWHELSDRADELLKPALRLSSEVSHAYAEILQQMSHLTAFAELRTDPLTGVLNRRAFDDTLSSLLSQQIRYGTPLSIAMLDIDLFKRVNDEKGHLVGDRILQQLAQVLKTDLRECDVLARYGGEEFVILMPQTELGLACSAAERMRAKVAEALPVTVSIGLAAAESGEPSTALLTRADSALYSAKHCGRNCVHLHEGASGRIVAIKPSHELKAAEHDGQTHVLKLEPMGAEPAKPTATLVDSEAC